MTCRINKIKKFMKENEKTSKIANIMAYHLDLSADDEKVVEAADEIYRYIFGERVHIDP